MYPVGIRSAGPSVTGAVPGVIVKLSVDPELTRREAAGNGITPPWACCCVAAVVAAAISARG